MNTSQKIYNTIVGQYLQNTLRNKDWKVYNNSCGVFIAHKEFLHIQDELDRLDQKQTGWNKEECIVAVSGYLDEYNHYRKKHIEILQAALNKCEPQEQKVIKASIYLLDTKITLSSYNNILIGIPWYTDNTKLWENYLKITEDEVANFTRWSKISQLGLVFASRIHRHDNPEGHDYFSYASRNGHDPRTKFLLTARHEGSHGLIDALATQLLVLPTCNPISEGLAGYLGGDGREKEKTQIDLNEYLDFSWLNEKVLEKEGTYIASSRFFKSLECILMQRYTWFKANTILFHAILKTLIKLQPNVVVHENIKKYVLFYNEVLNILNIENEALVSAYNNIDTPSL